MQWHCQILHLMGWIWSLYKDEWYCACCWYISRVRLYQGWQRWDIACLHCWFPSHQGTKFITNIEYITLQSAGKNIVMQLIIVALASKASLTSINDFKLPILVQPLTFQRPFIYAVVYVEILKQPPMLYHFSQYCARYFCHFTISRPQNGTCPLWCDCVRKHCTMGDSHFSERDHPCHSVWWAIEALHKCITILVKLCHTAFCHSTPL